MTAYSSERSGRALFLQNLSLRHENIRLNTELKVQAESTRGRVVMSSDSEKLAGLLRSMADKFGDAPEIQKAIRCGQRLSGNVAARRVTK